MSLFFMKSSRRTLGAADALGRLLTTAGAAIGASTLPADPTGAVMYFMLGVEGLAGGAMLTMLSTTMLPEAFEQGGGTIVGMSTLGGFLAALSVTMM